MSLLMQQLVVIAAVVMAVTYIVIHFVRKRKLKAGCKSCPALRDLIEKNQTSGKASSV